MTPAQQTALEALAGRTFSTEEAQQVALLVASRRLQDIANILSIGKTRPRRTEIGIGTILAVFQGQGGQFMDTLVAIGQTNRDVYWLIEGTIKRGVLDAGDPATRAGIQGLMTQEAMAPFVPGMTSLLALGTQPDFVTDHQVLAALEANNA